MSAITITDDAELTTTTTTTTTADAMTTTTQSSATMDDLNIIINNNNHRRLSSLTTTNVAWIVGLMGVLLFVVWPKVRLVVNRWRFHQRCQKYPIAVIRPKSHRQRQFHPPYRRLNVLPSSLSMSSVATMVMGICIKTVMLVGQIISVCFKYTMSFVAAGFGPIIVPVWNSTTTVVGKWIARGDHNASATTTTTTSSSTSPDDGVNDESPIPDTPFDMFEYNNNNNDTSIETSPSEEHQAEYYKPLNRSLRGMFDEQSSSPHTDYTSSSDYEREEPNNRRPTTNMTTTHTTPQQRHDGVLQGSLPPPRHGTPHPLAAAIKKRRANNRSVAGTMTLATRQYDDRKPPAHKTISFAPNLNDEVDTKTQTSFSAQLRKRRAQTEPDSESTQSRLQIGDGDQTASKRRRVNVGVGGRLALQSSSTMTGLGSSSQIGKPNGIPRLTFSTLKSSPSSFKKSVWLASPKAVGAMSKRQREENDKRLFEELNHVEKKSKATNHLLTQPVTTAPSVPPTQPTASATTNTVPAFSTNATVTTSKSSTATGTSTTPSFGGGFKFNTQDPSQNASSNSVQTDSNNATKPNPFVFGQKSAGQLPAAPSAASAKPPKKDQLQQPTVPAASAGPTGGGLFTSSNAPATAPTASTTVASGSNTGVSNAPVGGPIFGTNVGSKNAPASSTTQQNVGSTTSGQQLFGGTKPGQQPFGGTNQVLPSSSTGFPATTSLSTKPTQQPSASVGSKTAPPVANAPSSTTKFSFGSTGVGGTSNGGKLADNPNPFGSSGLNNGTTSMSTFAPQQPPSTTPGGTATNPFGGTGVNPFGGNAGTSSNANPISSQTTASAGPGATAPSATMSGFNGTNQVNGLNTSSYTAAPTNFSTNPFNAVGGTENNNPFAPKTSAPAPNQPAAQGSFQSGIIGKSAASRTSAGSRRRRNKPRGRR